MRELHFSTSKALMSIPTFKFFWGLCSPQIRLTRSFICFSKVLRFLRFKALFGAPSRDSLYILPPLSTKVNTLFKLFSLFFSFGLCYNNRALLHDYSIQFAPVAQWIEHRPPEPGALVRFQSGVPKERSPVLRGPFSFAWLLMRTNRFDDWRPKNPSKAPGDWLAEGVQHAQRVVFQSGVPKRKHLTGVGCFSL